MLKPDLVSVVTAHMVYFCAFTHSEIFQKNARKLGVGRGQFHSGISGLMHHCKSPPQQRIVVISVVAVVLEELLMTHASST